MSRLFRLWFGVLVRVFRLRRSLPLENLALRQQLTVLKRKQPQTQTPRARHKLFWVLARRFWYAWKQSLIVVTPETVVRWHRTGFCMNWSFNWVWHLLQEILSNLANSHKKEGQLMLIRVRLESMQFGYSIQQFRQRKIHVRFCFHGSVTTARTTRRTGLRSAGWRRNHESRLQQQENAAAPQGHGIHAATGYNSLFMSTLAESAWN